MALAFVEEWTTVLTTPEWVEQLLAGALREQSRRANVVAVSFLGKWFGGPSADRKAVDETLAELDRLIAARPAFAAPVRWLRALAADLVPMTKPPPVTLSPETAPPS